MIAGVYARREYYSQLNNSPYLYASASRVILYVNAGTGMHRLQWALSVIRKYRIGR